MYIKMCLIIQYICLMLKLIHVNVFIMFFDQITKAQGICDEDYCQV